MRKQFNQYLGTKKAFFHSQRIAFTEVKHLKSRKISLDETDVHHFYFTEYFVIVLNIFIHTYINNWKPELEALLKDILTEIILFLYFS